MTYPKHPIQRPVSRREMLDICKCGFGSVAMVSLFGSLLPSCSSATRGKDELMNHLTRGSTAPGFIPKAKNIICNTCCFYGVMKFIYLLLKEMI